MDQQNLHWLAGLLEGKGSFLAGAPCEPNAARVMVTMTDRDVIERVARLFGVRYIHTRESGLFSSKWKPNHRVTLKGKGAVELMILLYPFMGIRRLEQIRRALASYNPQRPSKKIIYQLDQERPERDIYWLAGLLEGEGSFFDGPPSSPNRPRIQVFMTDEDIIAQAADFFGVRYSLARRYGAEAMKWKPAYLTHLRGKRAVELMKQLYPLMGNRRQEQITNALLSYDSNKRRKNTAKLSEEQALEIYRRVHNGERQHQIAADFGIDRTTIADIKRGKSWWWLTGEVR